MNFNLNKIDEKMAKKLKYGLYTPNYGTIFGYARKLAELSKEVENAGWDGYFIWDHILVDRNFPYPIVDPWVALAAMAISTERIYIGTTITPLPRRRPWKLARETVAIDHLSKGRMILSVGLGEPPEVEYKAFGEESDLKVRAKKLEEGIDILIGLWSGKPFSYNGEYYDIDNVRFLPKPVQKPRIPIWGAGQWPKKGPFIRAARKLDGIFPLKENFRGKLTLDDLGEIINFIKKHRKVETPFDVVFMGKTTGKSPKSTNERFKQYAEVGVTWWLEYFGATAKLEKIRERINLGPGDV